MTTITMRYTKGAFLVTKAVMPHMIEQGWGRVINISSRAYLGNPTQANYSAAKAGLIGMAKALAMEEGRYGITVNCVAPGRIATPRLDHLYPGGPTPESLDAIALRRWGTPREFGDVVCFLASERARYVTGQTVVVDGGLQQALF